MLSRFLPHVRVLLTATPHDSKISYEAVASVALMVATPLLSIRVNVLLCGYFEESKAQKRKSKAYFFIPYTLYIAFSCSCKVENISFTLFHLPRLCKLNIISSFVMT